MAKYRIAKIETINGLGEVSVRYYVQKMWLFFWLEASVKSQFHQMGEIALVKSEYCPCQTLDQAELILHHLISKRILTYNGHTIEKILNREFQIIYIDRSDPQYIRRLSTTGYFHSFDLDTLKESIDRRIQKNVVSYVG